MTPALWSGSQQTINLGATAFGNAAPAGATAFNG